jgi:hypothetical protein
MLLLLVISKSDAASCSKVVGGTTGDAMPMVDGVGMVFAVLVVSEGT